MRGTVAKRLMKEARAEVKGLKANPEMAVILYKKKKKAYKRKILKISSRSTVDRKEQAIEHAEMQTAGAGQKHSRTTT